MLREVEIITILHEHGGLRLEAPVEVDQVGVGGFREEQEEALGKRIRQPQEPLGTGRNAVNARMKAAGFEEIEWVNTGCVIASHCGPGSFGVATLAAGE